MKIDVDVNTMIWVEVCARVWMLSLSLHGESKGKLYKCMSCELRSEHHRMLHAVDTIPPEKLSFETLERGPSRV